MDVIDAIHSLRSIRAYHPQPPPRALIEDLIWAAAQAPSPPGSGDRPLAFVVIEGADRLENLGARALAYARDHDPSGEPPAWTIRPGFSVFWGAPVVALICARALNAETPFDACRAAQNLTLAAHGRGLGSCWLGAPLPWLRSPGVAEELELPSGYDPAVAVALGRAAGPPTGAPRPRPQVQWATSA